MRIGMWGVVAAAVLWGTAGLTAKVLTTDYGTDPLTIGAFRLLFGAPVLLAAAWRESVRTGGIGRLTCRSWVLLMLFGVGVAGYQACYFSAVGRTMVSTATLLTVCTAPLMVSVVARWWLKERWTSTTGWALVLGVTGTGLLIGLHSLQGLAEPRLWQGNLLALAAAACYGGYTLISKRLVRDVPPLLVIGIAFSIGAIMLLPVLSWPVLPWQGWLLLVYLGWVPTALAYVLFIHGMRYVTATSASIWSLAEPLTATLLAITLLGERLSFDGWLGAVILLCSMFLIAKKESQSDQSPLPTN
jgi:DME family drug/metabolite transporter